MFLLGCLALPWLWFVNAWYFQQKLKGVRRPNQELMTCEEEEEEDCGGRLGG